LFTHSRYRVSLPFSFLFYEERCTTPRRRLGEGNGLGKLSFLFLSSVKKTFTIFFPSFLFSSPRQNAPRSERRFRNNKKRGRWRNAHAVLFLFSFKGPGTVSSLLFFSSSNQPWNWVVITEIGDSPWGSFSSSFDFSSFPFPLFSIRQAIQVIRIEGWRQRHITVLFFSNPILSPVLFFFFLFPRIVGRSDDI